MAYKVSTDKDIVIALNTILEKAPKHVFSYPQLLVSIQDSCKGVSSARLRRVLDESSGNWRRGNRRSLEYIFEQRAETTVALHTKSFSEVPAGVALIDALRRLLNAENDPYLTVQGVRHIAKQALENAEAVSSGTAETSIFDRVKSIQEEISKLRQENTIIIDQLHELLKVGVTERTWPINLNQEENTNV
jgi:hypothetical protein